MSRNQKPPKLSKYGKWKGYKRRGFRFYFILVVTVVVFITTALSSLAEGFLSDLLNLDERGNRLLLIIGFSVVFGWILSTFVSMFLLKPIGNLQSAMYKVAKGDLEVQITEKNKIEEIENINHSFNIMIKELGANNEMQKDFISNVSHEFKTPLSAIEGYATLLQDDSLSKEERDEYINEIISTTTLMSDLVSNILLLSKIENQSIEFAKENFYLDEQIRKVVVMLEPKWSEKGLQIDANINKVQTFSNKSMLIHVWRNLIENAIKFSPKNGKITINLKEEGEKIIFSVADEGKGIKEEEKEFIFNKFYQADSSRKQEGNGLGLALVKKIMEAVGGAVVVENVVPNGCKFTITLQK